MCKSCFGDVEGESCGWPKGTVRSCIALIIIPISFISAISITIIFVLREQYEIASSIIGLMFTVVGTVIGYYFGSKQGENSAKAENAAKMILQTEHELIESRNKEIKYRKLSSENKRDIIIEMDEN